MKPISYMVCAGLLAGACALPVHAAKPPQAIDKSYRIEFVLPDISSYYTDVDGQTTLTSAPPVIVRLKNASPPSTAASNISSFKFSVVGLRVSNPVCPGAQCTTDGTTVYVTNISPPIQGQQVFPVTLSATSCVAIGEAALDKTSLLVSTGSQLTNDKFTLLETTDTSAAPFQTFLNLSTLNNDGTGTLAGILCGEIACNKPFTVPNFELNIAAVTGQRSANNLDGSCTTNEAIDYYVTNKLNTSDKSLHFGWAVPQNNPALFAYKVSGTPIYQVAFSNTAPVWIDAPLCEGPDISGLPAPTVADLPLPKSYGSLQSGITAKSTNIQVNVSSTPSVGQYFVIGSERLQLTRISSNTWSVKRGQNGTVAAPHDAEAALMSTPMKPIFSSQYGGDTWARVCKAWDDGTSAWFLDAGDPWVRVGQ